MLRCFSSRTSLAQHSKRSLVVAAGAKTNAFRGCASTSAAAADGHLHLVECPRDAMQGLKSFVPTADKIRFINQILKVGFDTVDCGSFVSPSAVPQMRDSAEVLEALDMSETKSKLLVVVANEKGAVTACKNDRVTYVGYPLSASETFQQRNTKRDIATAVENLKGIKKVCDEAGKTLVVYISMGFGNPYGDPYSPLIVDRLVKQMADMGVKIISLADTAGVGEAEVIHSLFERITPRYNDIDFGAHLHTGPVSADLKLRAALSAGCRRFDGALGGMGGCPFAKASLTGNVATETIIDTCTNSGHAGSLNLDRDALKKAAAIKDEIFGVGMRELVLQTVLRNENAFLDMCLKHFRAADVRQMGFIGEETFVESLRTAYDELGEEAPPEAKLRAKFHRADTSGDGCITFDEYMIMVRRGLRKRLERRSIGDM